MKGLSETVSYVNERMEELETKRELAVASSRMIIRKTKRVIHSIHMNEDHVDALMELERNMEKLNSDLRNDPEIFYSGVVEDARMEYAEASLLSAVVLEKAIPSFDTLRITPQSWIMGLADCIGEMRRMVLSRLMTDDLEGAMYMFSEMEDASNELLMFDVPDAILPLRRKQDIVRGIMERTRADVTNAILMKEYRKKHSNIE
ncbi:MAG: RNA-binding protein [Candidatus Methanomethylophilaceae archaeon]